mgnify:CR=1 FL=1
MEEDIIKQEIVLSKKPRITILNTKIDVLNVQETIDLVEQYIITKTPLHLVGVNADKINELNINERLKQIINSCGVINADGVSVIMASRFLGKPLPERVAGIDLMLHLISLSEKKNYSVYLLGARQDIVERTAKVLMEKHPGLNLIGIHNGYFKKENWDEIFFELKEKNPDLIFVGITSPLKEYLVEYFQNRGIKGVFMGVGGSFDVISGKVLRAPIWMQKFGLEWLFRVLQEPKRLFKRYFIGNGIFVKSIIREKLKGTP